MSRGALALLLSLATEWAEQSKEIDWLATDKQPEQDSEDSKTLQGTPDTRGVSIAHYYNSASKNL